MKGVVLGLFWVSMPLWAQSIDKHFPDNRPYTSSDRGYMQYGAPSLWGTSQYVLTFDDGPNPNTTPKVLDVLRDHNVKATFFIVGENINAKTIPIIQRMVNEGHLIGNHSWHHDNSNQQTQDQFLESMRQTYLKLHEVIASTGHTQNEVYFRFPGGNYGRRADYHHMNAIRALSQQLFGGNCINFVFWDHDTTDWWRVLSSAELLQNFKSFEEGGKYIVTDYSNGQYSRVVETIPGLEYKVVPKGGIVLMHDDRDHTPDEVRLDLEYAEAKGIRIVPLNEVPDFIFPSDRVCGL